MATVGKTIGLIVALLLGGCGVAVDVTKDRNYATDYAVGRVYALQQDCVAYRFDLPEFMSPWDVRPLTTAVSSVETYRANEAKFNKDGVYLLPAGTQIEYRSMSGWWGLGDAAKAVAHGRVVDGQMRGKMMVISGISVGRNDFSQVPQVDPAFLKALPGSAK